MCMCSRFAACSNTIDCGPSATAASTSMSRCIGRQCMKTAVGRASAISADGHLVRRQRQPLLRIVRLAHALVDVGVDRVRAGDGLHADRR